MATLRKRSKVWTPVLQQALKNARHSCHSCVLTGRPAFTKKISTSNLSRSFSTHAQLDFFLIEDMDPRPILHVRDTFTGFSSCAVLSSRDMDVAGCVFESIWIYVHGPPLECSGDPEFDNSTFKSYLERHHISFYPRPARRHNKTGFVESGHSTIKLLARRLAKDLDLATMTMGCRPVYPEIISQATYLRNILYGIRVLSSLNKLEDANLQYKVYLHAS
jgi:hypothetical protein